MLRFCMTFKNYKVGAAGDKKAIDERGGKNNKKLFFPSTHKIFTLSILENVG